MHGIRQVIDYNSVIQRLSQLESKQKQIEQ
jgi:hypothetical protein